MKKSEKTAVKTLKVKKLTPDDLLKITGGCREIRDCTGPGGATCIAYLVK